MSYMNPMLQEIIEAIKAVVKSADSEQGLCSSVTQELHVPRGGVTPAIHYWRDNRDHIFQTWEHFSGISDFPVPSVGMEYSPAWAYIDDNVPMYSGPYGEMRIKLALHVIEVLKSRMEEI